jgi:hypothetical protein
MTLRNIPVIFFVQVAFSGVGEHAVCLFGHFEDLKLTTLDQNNHTFDTLNYEPTLVTNAHPKVVKIQFSLTYYDFHFILNFVLSANRKRNMLINNSIKKFLIFYLFFSILTFYSFSSFVLLHIFFLFLWKRKKIFPPLVNVHFSSVAPYLLFIQQQKVAVCGYLLND